MSSLRCDVEHTRNEELIYNEFSRNNPILFKQPIVISFFSVRENRQLLTNVLIHDDKASKVKLDEQFAQHYRTAKVIKYLSNLIYFYSIDFDKKVRKHRSKYLAILDNPISKSDTEKSDTLLTGLSNNFDMEEAILQSMNGNIEQHIQDERVLKALKHLSLKQKRILELIYIQQLKHKEIALIDNKTPQSISQLHKQALKNLKEHIVKEDLK